MIGVFHEEADDFFMRFSEFPDSFSHYTKQPKIGDCILATPHQEN